MNKIAVTRLLHTNGVPLSEAFDATNGILDGREVSVRLSESSDPVAVAEHLRRLGALADAPTEDAPTRSKMKQPKDVVEFKRALNAYVRKATSSTEAANKAMMDMGIHTRTGKLTKNYK